VVKDKPTKTVPGSATLALPEDPVIRVLSELSEETDTRLYIVGGYVRDLLLKRPVKEMDVMAAGDGIAAAKAFAAKINAKNVVIYQKFGTAMVELENRSIEFVGARKEKYHEKSRKPSVTPATVKDDLSRRDFTVNAMAAALHPSEFGALLDPFRGRADLKKKLLRTPLDPDETFDDDPLRMMRAIRFAATLGFLIHKDTLQGIKNNNTRISIVSQERITDELLKILRTDKPSSGFIVLKETGLLEIIFPEFVALAGVDQRYDQHHKDVFYHTLQVVDNISETTDDVWLRLVALLHDIAKPRTKAFHPQLGWTFHGHEELGARMIRPLFKKFKLPLDRVPYVEKLVRLHLRPMALVDEGVTDSAVRRLLFEAGEDIDDLMKLCRADITSKNPRKVQRYLNNYHRLAERMAEIEEKDRLRNWQPPIRGDEIMERFNLPPSKLVGLLKKALEDAILDGIIPNEYDAALEYLIKVKDDIIRTYQEKAAEKRKDTDKDQRS
jgi:poly(A) polymerase